MENPEHTRGEEGTLLKKRRKSFKGPKGTLSTNRGGGGGSKRARGGAK